MAPRANFILQAPFEPAGDQPKAITETLQGLTAAAPPVPGIFAAVPYCIDLLGGPYIETDETVCKSFRPKSAIRAAPP